MPVKKAQLLAEVCKTATYNERTVESSTRGGYERRGCIEWSHRIGSSSFNVGGEVYLELVWDSEGSSRKILARFETANQGYDVEAPYLPLAKAGHLTSESYRATPPIRRAVTLAEAEVFVFALQDLVRLGWRISNYEKQAGAALVASMERGDVVTMAKDFVLQREQSEKLRHAVSCYHGLGFAEL